MYGGTNWKKDKDWSDKFLAFVEKVLTRLAVSLVTVRSATDEEDRKRATDFVIVMSGGEVAARFRRPRGRPDEFRDWTVRSRRESGAKTELAKLREGFARWYVMAWTDSNDEVVDYVVIDMQKVRSLGILANPGQEYPNRGEGTWFVGIRVSELRAAGCLTIDECRSPSPLPRGGSQPEPPPAADPFNPEHMDPHDIS